MAYAPEESIAAIATALAPAALGIIRVSGKNCISLVASIFSRSKALKEAPGNTIVYGWIINPKTHERVDEVLLAVYRNPKSFTGEDMVEIFCHGGISPVKAVYNLLLKNGCRQAERGEYTFRAFINGKTDLTRAEAVREIIDSKTDISRGKAATRLSGSLFDEIDRIKKMLTKTLARIEAEIEYPEDENAIADAFNPTDLLLAKKELEELSRSWNAEKLYQEGAKIVLCGRTNAGKSSLFNTLLKEDRAIVSDIHGTTRDWIESWISFEGIPARLFDTAGLRETDDTIEQIGVERTKELASDADLVLYLIDASKKVHKDDEEMLNALLTESQNIPLIIVQNKIDKNSNTHINKENVSLLSQFEGKSSAIVSISAKNSLHIQDLTTSVNKALCSKAGLKEGSLEVGLGSERQKRAVDRALLSIESAIKAPLQGLGGDAVVLDIEDSIGALGEITGEVSPDDILGNIFSQFCVGK